MEKLLYKLSDEMSNEKINLADYGVDLDKLFCSIIKNKIIGIAYDKIIDTFNNRELCMRKICSQQISSMTI